MIRTPSAARLVRLFSIGTTLLGCLLLGACSSVPPHPTEVTQLPSPVISVRAERLPPHQLAALLKGSKHYHLGPGDVVSVSVYLHPHLSVPEPGITAGGLPGAQVDNDGSMQLPMLGSVQVQGLTLGQLRDKLTRLYASQIRDPEVSLQLQQPRSIRYYMLGEFGKPGIIYADRPMNLLQAMAAAGSVTLAQANLRSAYVVQDGRKLPIDFNGLLERGDLSQDIVLQTGDTVFVPSNANMLAFVLGSVAKPGPVPFVDGHLSLLAALSAAGLDTGHLTTAQLRDVRIIRSEGPAGELYVVDAQSIAEGKAAPFPLKAGDIVYVPQNGISSWNQALQLIIPSLQALSDVLNPFVSAKYLGF